MRASGEVATPKYTYKIHIQDGRRQAGNAADGMQSAPRLKQRWSFIRGAVALWVKQLRVHRHDAQESERYDEENKARPDEPEP